MAGGGPSGREGMGPVTVVRTAAWNAAAQQADGWTDSFVWYAVAIREMKTYPVPAKAMEKAA